MQENMEAILSTYYANELGWNLLAGAAVISIAVFMTREKHEWWKLVPLRRGKRMRRARRNFVRAEATYAFVSHVEDCVYNKTYTREEASDLYRDMKKCFPIKEMFPSPELLKENIRKRLAAHIHEPVTLPDGKGKARPKHMFEKPAKA